MTLYDHRMPRFVGLFGALGVVPFAIGGICLPLTEGPIREEVATALIAYGAVILSFLGGIHWGQVVADGSEDMAARLALGTVPALIAWFGLLLGGSAAIGVLLAAFLVMLVLDLWLTALGAFPLWYGRLRRPLTLAVSLCLGVALLGL